MLAKDDDDAPGAAEPSDVVDEGIDDAAGDEPEAQEIEVVSIEGLIEKARTLEARLKRSEDALKRERADFINYRRRVERQMEEMNAAARAELAADLFAFFDTFFHTAQGLDKHEDFESLREAFSVLDNELTKVLEDWNLELVGRPGEPFDPERHEAVYTRPDDSAGVPEVDEVVRPGYALGGRILRAAQVAVRQPTASREKDVPPGDDRGEADADV